MITPAVESALRSVYERIPGQRSNHYQTEISERALDELVANGDRTQPPAWQVRNAVSNAAKVLKRRAELAPRVDHEFADISLPERDNPYARFEILEWLRTTDALRDDERVILTAMATDIGVQNLAERLGLPAPALAVKISRIRRKAWAGWLADTV